MSLPKNVAQLSEIFSRLPGIGPKLSSKISLYLAAYNKNLANKLFKMIEEVVQTTKTCTRCNNITQYEVCEICESGDRDKSKILIIENSLDLYSIEETSTYDGQYFVLMGIISPVNGVGPDDIPIDALVRRVIEENINEVIFGLNPTIEGDSTMMFIKEEISIQNNNVKFTRLAKGIPTGSSIEYMSSQTLADSLNSRRDF